MTVFSLYEIIAAIMLHCPRTCDAMFGGKFCMSGGFKYFIGMVVVPVIAMLICMWIHEIFAAHRMRHGMMRRAKNAARDAWDNVKERVSANVSRGDIEKFLMAAALVGVKKYVSKHPGTKNTLKKIFEQSDINIADIVNDDDDEDIYDDDMVRVNRATRVNRTARTSAARRGGRTTRTTTRRRK